MFSKKEFDRSLSDEGVNIIDPFTGTGTFITRLLQSGLIKPEDLERKYKNEIFANEFLLLAYYIAAVNIENVYHDLTGKEAYDEFPGIVLTDTFQLYEDDDNEKLFSNELAGNSERLQRQKQKPLRVIIGNPPYSIGQKSENDEAQNQKYPKLDRLIASSYAKGTTSKSIRSLYDPYIKSFRWATERLGSDGGVIGFVSNGSWLDGSSQIGMRSSIEKDFSSIHIFNLRGNQRTSGELSRREGGKIFGSGSRTPITITILVKNPSKKNTKAEILYHDIGDYLKREEKLDIIANFKSISSENMRWEILRPNEHGDWINLRNDFFDAFIPLDPARAKENSVFCKYTMGIASNRDAWVYNFSKQGLSDNIKSMSEYFNSLVNGQNTPVNDSTKISWSVNLKKRLKNKKRLQFRASNLDVALYRPYQKQNIYFDEQYIERPRQTRELFVEGKENLVINTNGVGGNKEFSALMSDIMSDFNNLEAGAKVFPLYYYEARGGTQAGLFESADDYVRRDGISDFIFKQARDKYADNSIEKEDIFYYVYGLLHSLDYRRDFSNDLKKMLPRLPLVDTVEDFWAFCEAGRKLGELHVNYEKVKPYAGIKVNGDRGGNYYVDKLKFIKKDDRSTIIYNNQITIENIPDKAYEYVVNGRSAVEWILDRYQFKTDKASGIVNDPNDWASESGNPRYILDLLLSVISVSIQTVDIVNSLPKLMFNEQETNRKGFES